MRVSSAGASVRVSLPRGLCVAGSGVVPRSHAQLRSTIGRVEENGNGPVGRSERFSQVGRTGSRVRRK